MDKNAYLVARHGEFLDTFVTNSGTDVIEALQDFLYDGGNDIGHKFIVERVAGIPDTAPEYNAPDNQDMWDKLGWPFNV